MKTAIKFFFVIAVAIATAIESPGGNSVTVFYGTRETKAMIS